MPQEGWKYAANPIGTENTAPPQEVSVAGSIDPIVGSGKLPITVGYLRDIAQRAWQTANSVSDGGLAAPGMIGAIKAYHGSPHSFDRFNMSKIGTGEGNQIFGHGLYFAGNEQVARHYRDMLSPLDTAVVSRDVQKQLPESVIHQIKTGNARQALEDYVGYLRREGTSEAQLLASRLGQLAQTLPDGPLGGKGHMYEVNLNVDPNKLLSWDQRLSTQSPYIQEKLGAFAEELAQRANDAKAALLARGKHFSGLPLKQKDVDFYSQKVYPEDYTGKNLYQMVEARKLGAVRSGDKAPETSQYLNELGIPGTRYLDANSRSAGSGTSNYVAFNDKIIEVLRKYGILPPAVGGAAVATASQGDSL